MIGSRIVRSDCGMKLQCRRGRAPRNRRCRQGGSSSNREQTTPNHGSILLILRTNEVHKKRIIVAIMQAQIRDIEVEQACSNPQMPECLDIRGREGLRAAPLLVPCTAQDNRGLVRKDEPAPPSRPPGYREGGFPCQSALTILPATPDRNVEVDANRAMPAERLQAV